MLVTFSEASSWKWWRPRFCVETYDKVFDEYIRYDNMTWLEMVFMLRYYRRTANATVKEATA